MVNIMKNNASKKTKKLKNDDQNQKKKTTKSAIRLDPLIRKPWEQSTGAKTAEGKAVTKMNAYKHGGRCKNICVISKNNSQL